MLGLKTEVYNQLLKVSKNVSDEFPKEFKGLNETLIQYTEEENKVYERTDNKEQMSYVRYRIDIWNQKSTTADALAVDNVMSELGLVRTSCSDVDDERCRHKTMRYEGIIDCRTKIVYFNL